MSGLALVWRALLSVTCFALHNILAGQWGIQRSLVKTPSTTYYPRTHTKHLVISLAYAGKETSYVNVKILITLFSALAGSCFSYCSCQVQGTGEQTSVPLSLDYRWNRMVHQLPQSNHFLFMAPYIPEPDPSASSCILLTTSPIYMIFSFKTLFFF